jgi:hypothetical protein
MNCLESSNVTSALESIQEYVLHTTPRPQIRVLDHGSMEKGVEGNFSCITAPLK